MKLKLQKFLFNSINSSTKFLAIIYLTPSLQNILDFVLELINIVNGILSDSNIGNASVKIVSYPSSNVIENEP